MEEFFKRHLQQLRHECRLDSTDWSDGNCLLHGARLPISEVLCHHSLKLFCPQFAASHTNQKPIADELANMSRIHFDRFRPHFQQFYGYPQFALLGLDPPGLDEVERLEPSAAELAFVVPPDSFLEDLDALPHTYKECA